MAQQQFSWRRSAHFAVLLSTALLSACGGDSDAPASRPPDPDGEVAALAANPSSISVRYVVADTYQGPDRAYTRQLSVVDTLSGSVVWQMPMGTGELDYPGWRVSESYQRRTTGPGMQYMGPQLLYFTRHGQVFQMDVSGSTTPVAQRISSVSDACGLGKESFPVEQDGRHDWFVVSTSGPDGDCALTNDNGQVLVSSGMPASMAAISVPAGFPVFLSRLPDAQEQSMGMLSVDRTLRRLVLRSNDLMQTLHVLPGDIAPNQLVHTLARLPGQIAQGLIQIGSQLHVIDWSGSAPTLGPVVATLTGTATTIPPLYQVDSKAIYLVDGRRILAIDGAGRTSTLATLPESDGNITGLWMTGTSVLALQADANHVEGLQVGKVLWSIHHATGAREELARGVSADDLRVVQVENGLVYYTRSHELNGFRLTEDLYKVRDTGKGRTLVASGIGLITGVIHPVFSADSVWQQSLVWCEPVSQGAGCGDGQLVSYDTSTLVKTTLGTLPSGGAYYTGAYVGQQAWVGAQNLLIVPQWFVTDNAESFSERLGTTFWLYDAGVANSLRPVQALP